MKILLVSGNYLPLKNGGIENYTHWLATILLTQQFVVEVASMNLGNLDTYFYEGIKVHNLKNNFSTFTILLKNENYDICHFQEYSGHGGIEIPWFKKAKESCKKVFFTFHLPYLTCYKGDFRYKGFEDCHTFIDSSRCTECVIADKIGYRTLGRSDVILKSLVAFLDVVGQKNRLKEKIEVTHQYLEQLIATCDCVFIIANWFKTILFENGYRNPSIKKIPNKVKPEIPYASVAQNGILKNRILFVGRIQQQKGLHLLCRAMKMLASNALQLDVYGNVVEKDYYDNCANEYLFNFKGTLARDELLKVLKEYDFLVLPSVFPEMYPLVIMDAFHRELPVIASTAKGNKDIVIDGMNGFLFDYDNATDLAMTIKKAYNSKRQGWNPTFSTSTNPTDIEEIVSYYV